MANGDVALERPLVKTSTAVTRTILALTVLVATVFVAGWAWEAFQSGRLSAGVVAWLCMGVSVAELGWYNVAKKSELNNQHVWKERDAAFISMVMCGTGVLLFATAMATGGPQITTHELSWNSGFWVPVLATGFLNIFIQYANVRSFALEDASLVGPISSTTPAIVIVMGMMFLGEYPGVNGWIGIWLLAIGTYLLQIRDLFEAVKEHKLSKSRGTLEQVVVHESGFREWLSLVLAPITALKASAGVRWAFLTVLLACITLNYDALVARNANVAFASACVFGLAGVGNLAYALRHRQFRGLDPLYAFQAIVLLIVLFAMLHVVLNVAFRATLMSHIGALKRLSIPLTILGAYFFLGEKKSFGGRLVGGIIMTIGAILISLDM